MAKSISFSFGRFNPPTIGHEKLMDNTRKANRNYRIYASQTQDAKKNPLNFRSKVSIMKAMFPVHARSISTDKVTTAIDVMVNLYKEKYTDVVMVVGSDRVDEFDKLLKAYNGKKARHGYYKFKSIRVISAGERDPDAEGVSGMSASKMRKAAQDNDYKSFQKGLPSKFRQGTMLFKTLQKAMGVKSLKEYIEFKESFMDWEHKEPVEYAEKLIATFGQPDELTDHQCTWYNIDGFKRGVVKDEYILHGSPMPHYDFVYSYIDLKVPTDLATKLAESSESIFVDFLKGEVGARCGTLSANATTLNYVMDVVYGRVKPSLEEYEKRIKSIKAGKGPEWWENTMNESRMAGTGFAVAMKDRKGWKIVFKGNSRDQDKEIKKLQKAGKKLGKDFKGYRTYKPVGYLIKEEIEIAEGRPNQAAKSLSDPKYRAKTEKDRKKEMKKGKVKHKGRMYEKIMTFKQAQEKDKKDQNKDPVGKCHEEDITNEGFFDMFFKKEMAASKMAVYKREYASAAKMYQQFRKRGDSAGVALHKAASTHQHVSDRGLQQFLKR